MRSHQWLRPSENRIELDRIKSSKIGPPILFGLFLWHSQNDTLSYIK